MVNLGRILLGIFGEEEGDLGWGFRVWWLNGGESVWVGKRKVRERECVSFLILGKSIGVKDERAFFQYYD